MTPILVNGRKPGASHSLLHGCCWRQFPAVSRGGRGDGSSVVLGERSSVCGRAQRQLLAWLVSSRDGRHTRPSEGSVNAVAWFAKWR